MSEFIKQIQSYVDVPNDILQFIRDNNLPDEIGAAVGFFLDQVETANRLQLSALLGLIKGLEVRIHRRGEKSFPKGGN